MYTQGLARLWHQGEGHLEQTENSGDQRCKSSPISFPDSLSSPFPKASGWNALPLSCPPGKFPFFPQCPALMPPAPAKPSGSLLGAHAAPCTHFYSSMTIVFLHFCFSYFGLSLSQESRLIPLYLYPAQNVKQKMHQSVYNA